MKRKPRIAMILPDRIEHPVGGMGVQAKYLIKHLAEDFDFTVHGFPDQTTLPYYYGVSNPLPKIQHGGLNTLTCQAAYLASVLSLKEKPDLIHATDYTEFLAGYYAAKTLGVPLVVSMQLSAHLMGNAGLFNSRVPESPDGIAIENTFREMELFGLQKADRIIHVSSEYKKIFSQIPGLDGKSAYIPNGVDLEEWEKYEKISLAGKNKRKIVYLGRLAGQKNISALIQARIPADIDLIYAGRRDSGPEEIFQQIILKTQSAQNIFWIDGIYGQDKVNLLRAADAVIIPSAHECHPIVMHEAMAAGCVVLHSGTGDMEEILTDDFAINCGTTPQTITESMEKLAMMGAEELARRKAAGVEKVKSYTWTKAAEKTKAVYDSALRA